MRGLLLLEIMRPKFPPEITLPVLGSKLPPVAAAAAKSLTGPARFARFKTLNASTRIRSVLPSATRIPRLTAKSTFACTGPRRQLRPTLPMSVPLAAATAASPGTRNDLAAEHYGRSERDGLDDDLHQPRRQVGIELGGVARLRVQGAGAGVRSKQVKSGPTDWKESW